MKVTVRYSAQARHAAGRAFEEIELGVPISIKALLAHLAEKNENGLRNLLVDANGNSRAAVLVFVNDEQMQPGASDQIKDGDEVEILSPISGG